MKPKHQRLAFILFSVISFSAAVLLVLNALKSDVVYFYAPSELANADTSKPIRIGGLVENGSLKHLPEGKITFTVTDTKETLAVHYTGILPALFREGQGVVAEGKLQEGEFYATRILAKHDETYMPPEVANTLKKQGHWKQQ